jgi:hypothetical protein
MKLITLTCGFLAITMLTGCIGLSIGGGTTSKPTNATVGQQLIDLQTAKTTGAISDAEYQAQKAKVLGQK